MGFFDGIASFFTQRKQVIVDSAAWELEGERILEGIRVDRFVPGSREIATLYHQSALLRAVVSRIATRAAAYPVHGVDSAGTMLDDGHPLSILLADPCPALTAEEVARVTFPHLLLEGEAFFYMREGAFGSVAQLWPMPPRWITRIPTDSDPTFRVQTGTATITLDPEEVLWIRDPDINDPYSRGRGAGISLVDELTSDEYAHKFLTARFANHNRPAGILRVGGPDTKASRAEMSRKFNAKHRGAERSGGIYISTARDLEFIPMTQDLDLAQFIDVRKFTAEVIRQNYGVPPEIVGDVTNSNRATITEAGLILAENVLIPLLNLYASAIRKWLVPRFDESLDVEYPDPRPRDPTHTLAVMNGFKSSFSINEVRGLAGEEPRDGGDDVPALTQDAPAPAAPTTPDEGDAENEVPPEFEDGERRARTVRKQLDADEEAEISLILAALVAEPLVTMMAPPIAGQWRVWAERAFEEIGAPVDVGATVAARDERFLRLVRNAEIMTETTRSSLRDALSAGYLAGETVQQLATRVRRTMATITSATGGRAMVAARTEAAITANAARPAAWRSTGRVQEKQWLATSVPPNARPDHAAYSGTRVPLDQDFEIGGASAPFPTAFGIAAHDVGCNCTSTAIVEGVEGRSVPAVSTKEAEAFLKAYREDLDTSAGVLAPVIATGALSQRDAVIARLIEVYS